MKNTEENAGKFYRECCNNGDFICSGSAQLKIEKVMTAYAASVRPEVVVPSERWINGFDRYISRPSVMDTIEEFKSLNPTLTFSDETK